MSAVLIQINLGGGSRCVCVAPFQGPNFVRRPTRKRALPSFTGPTPNLHARHITGDAPCTRQADTHPIQVTEKARRLGPCDYALIYLHFSEIVPQSRHFAPPLLKVLTRRAEDGPIV